MIWRICGLKLVINGPTVVFVNFEQRRSWNSDLIFPCIEVPCNTHTFIFQGRYMWTPLVTLVQETI